MSKNKCAVLVNSCDKYEDAWVPFFKLLEKYWKDCPYQYYLNTETKALSVEGVDVTVLNSDSCRKGNNVPWGKRLKDCLNRVQEEYVIILLEDFFMQAPVNQTELERCIRLMDKDDRYAAIYFKQIEGFTDCCEEEPEYFKMNENIMYKLNLQAGLWRKSDLETLTDDNDSPWEFEFVGQKRLDGSDKIFLCSKAGTHYDFKGAVFPYLTGRSTGYGIWKGKWLWNNDKLLRKNGIENSQIKLERFSRLDMLKYYMDRVKEEIGKKLRRK